MDGLAIGKLTDRIIESSVDERIVLLEQRLKRVESLVNHAFCVPNDRLVYMCNGLHPHPTSGLIRKPHRTRKALYCEVCDKLYCKKKYCNHLAQFVKNINKN